MDACKGTKKTIDVTPIVDCSPCTGTGLKPGIKRTRCSACNGTGTRTFVVDSGFRMASTCQACQGVGTAVPQGGNCTSCDGLGKVRRRKSVVVNIPAGKNKRLFIQLLSSKQTISQVLKTVWGSVSPELATRRSPEMASREILLFAFKSQPRNSSGGRGLTSITTRRSQYIRRFSEGGFVCPPLVGRSMLGYPGGLSRVKK